MAAPESTMRYSVLSDAAIFTCFFMTPDGSISYVHFYIHFTYTFHVFISRIPLTYSSLISISYIHLIYSSMASATTLE